MEDFERKLAMVVSIVEDKKKDWKIISESLAALNNAFLDKEVYSIEREILGMVEFRLKQKIRLGDFMRLENKDRIKHTSKGIVHIPFKHRYGGKLNLDLVSSYGTILCLLKEEEIRILQEGVHLKEEQKAIVQKAEVSLIKEEVGSFYLIEEVKSDDKYGIWNTYGQVISWKSDAFFISFFNPGGEFIVPKRPIKLMCGAPKSRYSLDVQIMSGDYFLNEKQKGLILSMIETTKKRIEAFFYDLNKSLEKVRKKIKETDYYFNQMAEAL